MNAEYNSHQTRGTWTLMPPPPNHPIIGSKWVFQRKKDTSGQTVRYKARFVAQGYSQQYGVDFSDVFAPVAMQSTLRVLLAITGQRKLEVRHVDVKSAYLNGKLEEDVYVRQPIGFEEPGKEEHVCKLHKSCYGLKQSARVWNTTVKAVLSKLGFHQSLSDPCLFMKRSASGEWIYLLIYVDDMILVCKEAEQITIVEKELQCEFDISILGSVSQFLGMRVSAWMEQRSLAYRWMLDISSRLKVTCYQITSSSTVWLARCCSLLPIRDRISQPRFQF